MKKLLLALTLATLPSCVLVDSYLQAHFDNNEYAQINAIRTLASLGKAKCGTDNMPAVASSLAFDAEELKNYSSAIPHNDPAIKMTTELSKIVVELNNRYASGAEVSKAYCELKLTAIEKDATTIQTAIGAKPR